jgi:diguanylate cyclase (GGDEF)-like protein/PAS domain S-box-containing protein
MFSYSILRGAFKSVFFLSGITAAFLFWFADSMIGSFYFKKGTLYEEMFFTDVYSFYMRVAISFITISICFICSVLLYRAKQSELILKENEIKYRSLLETAPDGIVIVNKNGSIEIVNKQLQCLTGYTANDLIGQSVEILIPERFKTHKQQRDKYLSNPHTRKMGSFGTDLFVRRKDGSEFPADISLSPLKLTSGMLISSSIRDITERKQVDDLLTYQANYDDLTGLVNRREFERRTERLLSTVRQNKSEHALCFMDLDQFKVVNDTCGHIAGDEMLRQLSSLLNIEVRHRDTLARLGGDEFAILMEYCSLENAQRVAASLQKAIQDFRFSWEGHNFRISVSMGLVAITESTFDLTELLSIADVSCYMAKEKGRNCIHVHNYDDKEMTQRYGEMEWVTRINHALEEDRFCLYAQPIMSLESNVSTHYEFLIRMIDENGDTISPGAFLPAAERYNLISKLDRWIIKNAFKLLSVASESGEQIDFYSINLSGQSLADVDFLDFIVKQFSEMGVQASKVCFEITETAAITNLSMAINFISTLKALGCRFSLDDFGSGLSSFGYLKHLPVDYLKIDGMFVKDIVDDPIDMAMVKSINEIGHVMGMQTIAEFVEDNEIKNMLIGIGVDYGQGYEIGKPQPFSRLFECPNNVVNIHCV